MIYYLYGDSLSSHQTLSKTMFRDRAAQFYTRLGWDVSVNDDGEERDQYDYLNPLYVIVADDEGRHSASVRFLPTIGQTMVNDQFVHITDGVEIRSPLIWECTRFCIAPNAQPNVALKLVAAGAKLMREFGIEHVVGVFDRHMQIIYQRIGAKPTVIGWSEERFGKIGVGLWEFDDQKFQDIAERSGLSELELELYIVNSDVVRGTDYSVSSQKIPDLVSLEQHRNDASKILEPC